MYQREYVYIGDMPAAKSEREYNSAEEVVDSHFVWVHTDHLKTPRRATDSSGTT